MYQIISQDITTFDGDAILNSLGQGEKRVIGEPGGVFRSILKKTNAGLSDEILSKGAKLGFCDAFLTESYGLPCKSIIHVISPYKEDDDGSLSLLKKAYSNALDVALKAGLKSICLPLIGTGANHYQIGESLKIAKDVAFSYGESNRDVSVFLDVYWPEKPQDNEDRSRAERRRRSFENFERKDSLEYEIKSNDLKLCLDTSYSALASSIRLEDLDIQVGDSFGRLLDLFFAERDGSDDKESIDQAWNDLTKDMAGVKEDYYADVNPDFTAIDNIKNRWHKHANAKKGEKKTPGIAWGQEDPNGVWQKPSKNQLILVACSLKMSKHQALYLYRFCGYYLSKYDKEDLAIMECFCCLENDDPEGSCFEIYKIYEERSGKKTFGAIKKDTWKEVTA
jgi:O-acetyl-ADP-ribose deacetylase (regulator of RNase III)